MGLVRAVYSLLGGLVCLAILLNSQKYFTTDNTLFFLEDKPRFFSWVIGLHVLTASSVFFIGLFQFIWQKNKAHRYLGKVYVYLILIVGCPTAFYMSFFAIGGWLGTINFLAMTLLWFFFTMKAADLAVHGKFKAHKKFMSRSFIITNSAILLRLLVYTFNTMEVSTVSNNYLLAAFLSWFAVLVAYEVHLKLKYTF